MPAFYSRTSGLDVDERVETAEDVAILSRARDELGLKNSILVTVPVPAEFEIDRTELESILADALKLADKNGINGKEITPFLLAKCRNAAAAEHSPPTSPFSKTTPASLRRYR